MPSALDVFFEEYSATTEVFLGEALDGSERIVEFRIAAHQLHPDPAAAGGAFQHYGVADARGFMPSVVEAFQQPASRQQRDADARRQFARHMLETETAHLRCRRTDEYDARGSAAFGEVGILAQEPIARMNRLGAGRARCGQQLVLTQIALRRRSGSDADGLIRLRDMRRISVGVRVHRDGANLQALERSQNTAGNLSAIRDQNLSEHRDPR